MSEHQTRHPPGFYRFKLGRFWAIPLHDGVFERDRPPGFVLNADEAAVGEAFAQAGMPRDKLTMTFTPLLIDTGDRLVLIDAGFGLGGPPGTGRLVANMRAAGIEPERIDAVIVSHFHNDHILGLRQPDGAPTFPNARLAVPEGEWAFWIGGGTPPETMKAHAEIAQNIFAPIADQVQRFAWGEEILPGFTAVDAHGHTPGMAAIEVASGDASLLYVADVITTPMLFARHPEWQCAFDVDPAATIATRRRLFDRAASQHMLLSVYHAPFPGNGTVVKNGDGYDYLPALWTTN